MEPSMRLQSLLAIFSSDIRSLSVALIFTRHR